MKLFTSILLSATLLLPVTVTARTPLDFFKAPEAQLALLDVPTRLDMADYFESGMAVDSKNAVGDPVRILSADSTSMKFRDASNTETALSLLTSGTDTLLVMTQTIHMPQLDGRVRIFDKSWQPLPDGTVPDYTLADWLTEAGKAERTEVESWLPFILATPSFDPAARRLTWTNTMMSMLAGDEESANVAKWLKPSISYSWTGKKFKLDKK